MTKKELRRQLKLNIGKEINSFVARPTYAPSALADKLMKLIDSYARKYNAK